ncbi:MAG TPA: hypothetical protein ENN84_01980 [Candidatus Marinimicrobia bacterium]|nr:hypothetical protein [Candidatus Neomarinimicrobiota bacterium]
MKINGKSSENCYLFFSRLGIQKILQKMLLTALFLGQLAYYQACEKELPLSVFLDDYDHYEPELRIEAILDPVNAMNSIVRVDRSVRIDDIEIYNGLDDDGDWQGFSDLNGNGKWDPGEPLNDDLGEDGLDSSEFPFLQPDAGEGNGRPDPGEPNVDEYDEILPMLHDSTATVWLTKACDGLRHEFIWQAKADSFEIIQNPQSRNDPNIDPIIEMNYYGAYRPKEDFYLDCSESYIFTIRFDNPASVFYGLEINGETKPLPAPQFIKFSPSEITSLEESDTLFAAYGDTNFIFWLSDLETSTYYVEMESYFSPDSIVPFYTHPSFPSSEFLNGIPDYVIGLEPLTGQILPGLYRFSVSVMDPAFGNYYYSNLPIKDPEKSNLRDQEGRVVIGVVGSIAKNSVWLRVQ